MSERQPSRRRRRSVQITERDLELLAFAAEHRFVLADHIAKLLGISEAAAAGRLRALGGGGYLAAARPLRYEPTHYWVTTSGLRAIGSDLPRPRTVDLATYRHEAGVAWLTVGARHGMFGPLAETVSERRMRSQDGRPGGGTQPFGVSLRGVGRDGRERLHYPDLLLVTDTGHRVAVELELTTKETERRERILAAYAAERRIDAVVYLVDDPARRRAIQDSVRRLGLGDRVRVEQVSLGHRPRGPSTERPAQRAAWRPRDQPRRSGPETVP